ncbi:MAG TPA: tetratricopeptide repeat protein [Bryobacteraceae bacterium]|nr:tetratricopeptide repeat protein [Bryobacteraceae bacterium]
MLYGVFLAAAREEYAKAAAEAKLALDLAPLSQYVNTSAAWVHVFVDNHAEAIEQARGALELFPESLQGYYTLGLAVLGRGGYEEAISVFEKAAAISPDAISISYLGHAQARAGHVDAAIRLTGELLARSEREHIPPRTLAILYTGLGDFDRAFEWLERAFRARDSGLLWLRVLPLYDSLRSDPRFEGILRRVGLLSGDSGQAA